MKKAVHKEHLNPWMIWTPRALSLLFVVFLSLFSLDVFDSSHGFWQTMLALLMHNIPTLIMLVFAILAWRFPLIGAIGFFLGGLAYILLVVVNPYFEPYMLSWCLIIAGPAFAIGMLYLLSWFIGRKQDRKKTESK
jgi:hypothetical protein